MLLMRLFDAVFSLFNTVLRGFLIKTFWVWFIISQFPDAPRISTVAGIGFSLMVGVLAPWKSISARDLEDLKKFEAEERLVVSLLSSLGYLLGMGISLGVGWIVHALM